MKRLVALLLLACLPALSGCMVVGAAVSVGGYVLGGPVQYAGTALSVCEYGYEMAVNDKSPDEVIQDKIATVVDILDGPDYAGPWETGLDREGPAPVAAASLASLSETYGVAALPEAAPEAHETLPSPFDSVLLADLAAPETVQAAAPTPRLAPEPAATTPARVPAPVPVPAPVLTDWPTLADAEAAAIPTQESSWSVRLPVTNPIL
ncbi:MAG: hypothetical protein AB7D51_15100 [Desulfovibrionaceae bacterium]